MAKTQTDEAAQLFMKQVGNRLREARKAKGWSLQYVATRFSVTKATVGHWETGVNPIDIRRLYTLARFYETTVMAMVADDMSGDDAAALIKRQIDAAAEKARSQPKVGVSARGDRYPLLPAPPSPAPAPATKPAAPAAKRRTPS